jgi:dTDP-4-amino-4,6-dideoxygalactose transaminase
MDLEAAEAAVTPRTRAILPVHLAGRVVDLDALDALARRHDLIVIEDAAHAIGAEWRGRKVGSGSRLAAFSFYAGKNITTGEGGAIATDDAELATRIEQLALHGLSVGAWKRFSDDGYKHYEATALGSKLNMTDMQASLGIHQLPRLDGWIERRAELWEHYDELLSGLPLELPPAPPPTMRHARHLYQVRLEPDLGVSRDEVLDTLTAHRIGAGVHYRAVHLHGYYSNRFGFGSEDFPVAADISERTLSLPLSPGIDEADQADVAEALAHALV